MLVLVALICQMVKPDTRQHLNHVTNQVITVVLANISPCTDAYACDAYNAVADNAVDKQVAWRLATPVTKSPSVAQLPVVLLWC